MKRLRNPIQILIMLVMIFSLAAPPVLQAGAKPTRLQPALVEIAASTPDRMVQVIVQKAEYSGGPEHFVSAQGGEILRELALINAFTAQLPASAVTRLSQLASVSWVSLDAQMVAAVNTTTSPSDYHIRDEFNSADYSGNDGTAPWIGDWQEIGELNGPENGWIRVKSSDYCASSSCLRIGGDEIRLNGHGAIRSIDLRGVTSATFSFNYRRDIDDDGGVMIPVVSNDGGSTWIYLDKISISETLDKTLVNQSYDLTPYLSNELQIGFLTYAEEIEGYVYIDEVQIEYRIEKNTYSQTLGIEKIHADGITGQGIGIAVIDSGIGYHKDLNDRIFAPEKYSTGDVFGHGTHVAGIIGGDGAASDGLYSGIAPKADFITLGVSDALGMAYESDVVYAMQWVFENKEIYNIRVVNLSLNSTLEDSYHNSPIPAAAEILWFNDIVVVASVGNTGAGGEYNTARTSPANDPFIITVGASNENGSPDTGDDSITSFSAYGTTLEGHERPDLIAPGSNIVSALSPDSTWDDSHPDRVGIGGQYIRLSGTSMSAPMATGVVALLLQDEPNLTPDQVKFRLMDTGSNLGGYPYLNAYAAVHGSSIESANQDLMPHMLLAKMAMIAYWASVNGGDNIEWENVDWGSVNWNSVNWNSVNWNSVNWNSVNWNSVNWNSVNWNSVNWNSVNWNSVNWNSVNWNSVNWNSVNWNSVQMNVVDWDE